MVSSSVSEIVIAGRRIGTAHRPWVIPEIGINHGGSVELAHRMIDDAAAAGAEVVKFQSHSPADEMVPNNVVPANAEESIWDIIDRCTLTWDEERELKEHADAAGLVFLSTPFSREAADHLDRLGVEAFKIGSGECNNLPLLEHVAQFGRPMILSTGMNDLASVARSVELLRDHRVPFALLHCTSLYPTPRRSARLGAIGQMQAAFPDAVIGYSDHTLSNHVALGAVALGAAILERHFTSDLTWPGPDIEISMGPIELRDLVDGSAWIHEALGGSKTVLPAEQPTIDFAFASVVTLRDVAKGERIPPDAVWVKRPGTGEIPAARLSEVVGAVAACDLVAGHQVRWSDLSDGV